MMKYAEWVKTYKGKKLDPDGYAGVQCVDLIKHYCHNVIGIDRPYTKSWGNAVTWFTEFDEKPWLVDNFKKIPYKKGLKIKKGDIAVFKSKSKYGHIAVCTGAYDDESFKAYDQNYNDTHAGMTLREFGYAGTRTLLGVLRPRDQSRIITAPTIKLGTYKLISARGVYKGYGKAKGRKKIKELPETAQKHCTKKKSSADAVFKTGTKIKILEIKQIKSGNLWAKTPSGYLCIWTGADRKYFII